jgi:broad specificity phosphatase PhoE
MVLYLVRHGRAAAGIENLDPGLDDLGRTQAVAAAKALAERTDGTSNLRLFVSPMRRTRETAEPIAKLLGLSSEIRPEVSEVFDSTMLIDERRSMLGPFLAGHWNGQSAELLAFRERVLRTLIELGKESAIVVSHYVAISVALGEALGDDRIAPVPVPNASISRLDVREQKLVLLEAAGTAHLTEGLVTGASAALVGSAPTLTKSER